MPNYSLSADPLTLAFSQQSNGPPSLYADNLSVSFSMPAAGLNRAIEVDLGDLSLRRLSRLSRTVPIVDPRTGVPTAEHQFAEQRKVEAIETAFARLSASVETLQRTVDLLTQTEALVSEVSNTVMQVQETVAAVEEFKEQIEAGELNLSAVTIGGQRFVNNGGELVSDV